VVRHDVDDHLEAGVVQRRDQLIEVGERPEPRIDVAVVVHVVAAVRQLRRVERAQPHRVDVERRQVVDSRRDARQVADAITVAVSERAGVDLVHDGVVPPRRGRNGHATPRDGTGPA